MNYQEFLESKKHKSKLSGLSEDQIPEINNILFDFQKAVVKWALKKGKASIFADCGLGKTFIQLEWGRVIHDFTGKNILILAPLAVGPQTVKEGKKINIKVRYCRKQKDVTDGITITNYEMLHHFDPAQFVGIVLDESSILKSYNGKTRNEIIDSFIDTPYKLACTATPAPNDHMELGNHAEFMGVMSRSEMLSMFFVHDGGETQKWRLKGHAVSVFWEWVCSWAVNIRKPSDIGFDYEDKKFTLPELNIIEIAVPVDLSDTEGDDLLRLSASTLQDRQRERKLSIGDRCNEAAELCKYSEEPWLFWCNLNNESAMLKKYIEGSVEVKGSDSINHKESSMIGFSTGNVKRLITKPSIAGFGMNWQHCNNVVFVGLSDSYEQFYQAIRRCYRFGQKNKVNCYIVTAETEGAVVENIKRKEKEAKNMNDEMCKFMSVYSKEEISGTVRTEVKYEYKKEESPLFSAYLGDCVEVSAEIPDNSVHYSIFSPPFASLYTYSNSDRDMGNCKSDEEFEIHFRYLVNHLFRMMKPGRNVSVHCMNLPTSKTKNGYIGIRDFRGEIIRLFEFCGFIYHSEVCIWKDPVTAMQRTKALGLLHKQLIKDSAMSRQGIPDYLVTFRKPGENAEPVSGELDYWCGDNSFQSNGRLSIDIWQRYASPVWMDIRAGNTLQKDSERDEDDERHICPLQLDVIERGIQLWSNSGDLIFSPFMGIGSEGVVSIKTGRKFAGIELKDSYYNQAVSNLKKAEYEIKQSDLFTVEIDRTSPTLFDLEKIG
jgi:hypothetical protein